MSLSISFRPLTLATLAAATLFTITSAQAFDKRFDPAPVLPLPFEHKARLIVDDPDSEALKTGLVVVRYKAENLRLIPVYGANATDVSPRIGHIHVTVDDAPWHWADASGEPIILKGFAPGAHKILIELATANHSIIDSKTVHFYIPASPSGQNMGDHH